MNHLRGVKPFLRSLDDNLLQAERSLSAMSQDQITSTSLRAIDRRVIEEYISRPRTFAIILVVIGTAVTASDFHLQRPWNDLTVMTVAKTTQPFSIVIRVQLAPLGPPAGCRRRIAGILHERSALPVPVNGVYLWYSWRVQPGWGVSARDFLDER